MRYSLRKSIIVGFIVLMSLSASLQAQGVKVGEYVDVRRQEVVEGNRYFVGRTASIDGRVNGDVVILGDNVDVNGYVENDILALGRDVRIAGVAREDVRISGIDLFLSDSINGEAFAVGINVEVEDEAKIAGDVHLYGLSVIVGGETFGDLAITANRILIKGKIKGNATLRAYESLEFAPGAEVEGNLTCFSPYQPAIDKIRIGGEYHHEKVEKSSILFDFSSFSWVLWRLISAFISGSLMLLLFPSFFRKVVLALRPNPVPSALTGFILFFLFPALAMIFILIVFTFPLALSLLAILIFFLYMGRIVIALLIGELISRKIAVFPLNDFLFLLTGLLALIALGFVPVFGGFLVFLGEIAGMGALGKEFLKIIRDQRVKSPETV